jgi:hypothetical protein
MLIPNIDAEQRNADWIKGLGRAKHVGAWPVESIDAECAAAYAQYATAVRAQHIAYYATRPDQRSRHRPFMARRLADALPPGSQRLTRCIPAASWHRFHLSAASSQVLAASLLAQAGEPGVWLPGAGPEPAARLFEVELAESVLNERPRQTTLDYVAAARNWVVVAEAKFTEQGFGRCSCAGRARGRCADRVLERPYWVTARDELGLIRERGRCSLSTTYQAVRNIAAASALARGRRATFVLLYDERNPYFSGAGRWPGWVSVLEKLTTSTSVQATSLSWQRLLRIGVQDRRIIRWAAEKHGLVPT